LNIENCNGQWYQINLPVSGSVNQIQFINSNTGWINVLQSSYLFNLLRTTNAGINWQSVYSDSAKVSSFQFINDTLGYAMGYQAGNTTLSKTTNSGFNWIIMQSSGALDGGGFYMVNADTGWVNSFSYPSHYTFRTTNGFQTIENICNGPGGVPATLYIFKEKFNGEYCGYMSGNGYLWKTTNSGFNWTQINPNGTLYGYSFLNKDTGWVNMEFQNSKIYKTINGGLNWTLQFSYTNLYGIGNVFAVSNIRIWSGTDGYYVLASSNGGSVWGKQTSPLYANFYIYMYDTSLGFTWAGSQILKTTNGGGIIISVKLISENIPGEFKLFQNYPNPFNPTTKIKFDIPVDSRIRGNDNGRRSPTGVPIYRTSGCKERTLGDDNGRRSPTGVPIYRTSGCKERTFGDDKVVLKVYDILGKEIETLVNEKLQPETYEVTFNASQYPSGVYFYRLQVGDYNESKRMVLIK
jgi:photosystem II stability/assembly factor-like uncharacterized protein